MADYKTWSDDLVTVASLNAPQYTLSVPKTSRTHAIWGPGAEGTELRYSFECHLAELSWPIWATSKNEVTSGSGWQIDLQIEEVGNRGTEFEWWETLYKSRPIAQILEVGENHLIEALEMLGKRVLSSAETMDIILQGDFILFSPTIESDTPSVADTALVDRLS